MIIITAVVCCVSTLHTDIIAILIIGILYMDMVAGTIMTTGMAIHSSTVMAGGTAGPGDLGAAGTVLCGDGIILTIMITGAGEAAGLVDISMVA